jgi:hypothetical protein
MMKKDEEKRNVFTILTFMIKHMGEWMESEKPGLNPEGG